MAFGPIYDVTDATYIVKAGSAVVNFETLDQPGVKVAAVNNTTTMRGAIAHLKNAEVTGYQAYDEIFGLVERGEIDALRWRANNSTTWRRRSREVAYSMKPSSRPREPWRCR
jgi:hypothetical protein